MDAREYLSQIMPTRQQVKHFLTKRCPDGLQPSRGWTYDAELGFVHADAIHQGDGAGDTDTFYHYEQDGARKILNCRDVSCRIHTYGNSFTHCDQVNDGETWQEYLAAAINEPVRNYGVGGYSVYQAYRRMYKIHRQGKHIASHIIFNIYEDDHVRNLDAWRSIRAAGRTSCGWTLPHLKVDPDSNCFEEVENPLTSPDDVYQLCDADYLVKTFGEDLTLTTYLGAINEQLDSPQRDERVTSSSDVSQNEPIYCQQAREEASRRLEKPSLFATRCVVEMIEQFAAQTHKRLMFVLSFSFPSMVREVTGQLGYYQPFIDWLKQRGYPVVDMRSAFQADFAESRLSAMEYLQQYYNGHHTASGNFFTARAVLPTLVDWIEPKPAPYRIQSKPTS